MAERDRRTDVSSCDLARLYESGGLYEPPPSDGTIGNLGRWIEEVYPRYSYSRPLPAHVLCADAGVPESLERYYSALNDRFVVGARTGLFELVNVILFDRTLYAVVPPGKIVAVFESDRQVDRPWKSDLDVALLKHARKPTSSDAPHVYFSSVGSTNYGHWIVDDLTRAKGVFSLPPSAGKVVVVLDRYFDRMDDMRAMSLTALLTDGPDGEIVYIDKDVPYFFERLYYVSPSSYPPVLKSPEALRFLYQRLALPSGDAPQRIFLNREASWRKLLNHGEVSEFFTKLGFTSVSIGFATLTFDEQRRLFANAEIVVGVSGAAMVNTAFCPPGTKVVYLAGEGFVDPWYWDLAAIKGHEYSVCFGTPWRREAPNFASFTVEPCQLSAIAEWF